MQVFEAEARVNDSPRAATTHAATLEMLDELGLVDEVIRQGLVEPKFRFWDRATREVIAEFDFGILKERHALTPSWFNASSTSSPTWPSSGSRPCACRGRVLRPA